MNKIIIILIVMSAILLSPQYSYSDDFLKETIAAKNWDALAPQFLDDSHTLLKNYFTESKSIKFISYQANKLTYKVKFKNQGELGSIVFKKKNNKYSEIEIKNQIKPLYYIESFKKYKVAGTKCSIGDAEIHFISGHIYQSAPNDSLLLFKGKWKFYIKPNDDEEKLTLKRLYNKDFISRLNNTGIFIMENKDFLKKLTLESESCSLDFDLQPLFDLFNNRYGIKISQYNEYWYLPFPDSSNLAILAKDSKSFYFYSYGAELSPDTQLIDSQSNMIVLNYNHEKGLRLLFGSKAAVEGMQMNCTFDPTTHFISGTTTLSYNREASLRTLNMEERLRLVGNLNLESKGLTLFRQGKKYYLMGAEGKKLSLFFSGYLKPTQERMELFKSHDGLPPKIRATDPRLFYFLSNTQNFYPNPGDEFFKTDVTITLPGKLNCLASGSLVKQANQEDSSSYRFSSPATKGFSLVTGDFKLTKKLTAVTPIHFHSFDGFRYPKQLHLSELAEAVNLFSRDFGALDLPVINILIKKGRVEGGISNSGFIILNMVPSFKKKGYISGETLQLAGGATAIKKITNPILLRNRSEDHFIHELAHQWWGSLISWKTYRDVWITEGLAHFSLIYYLKQKMSPKKFNRMIKKFKKWVYRHSASGPIVYGTRIRLMESKSEVYQSVIYNKSAMVFLMAMELIGEKDFVKRLRSVTEKYKYKSISTAMFIRQFCGKNKMLTDFFEQWVYHRTLPEVKLEVVNDAPETDKKEFKTVVIAVKQLNTDYIFPLKLKVTTQKGESIESVVIKKKEQNITITREHTLLSVDVHDALAPIREKKSPRPAPTRRK